MVIGQYVAGHVINNGWVGHVAAGHWPIIIMGQVGSIPLGHVSHNGQYWRLLGHVNVIVIIGLSITIIMAIIPLAYHTVGHGSLVIRHRWLGNGLLAAGWVITASLVGHVAGWVGHWHRHWHCWPSL